MLFLQMKSDLLVELPQEEQEHLSGGQAAPADPLLAPIAALRGRPVNALGKALNDGSETKLVNNTIRGVTNSGPFGSTGNSNAEGEGLATGAEDIMILPPFLGSSQTL
ncbi:hypothetical protein VB711_12175 [Cronbergia sp. UHCC 0137]|uniref:hypothetical protein n=1 Tax=Cronbergia sp. UHCC 0137 TaxID=3110239 RepID=UPI002B1FA734|nr:hypothetical protein [Cronbergia sp. UHCC 0137]MEA5618587.1 hypothetical protein [Cronbergia sp. UHCC 0137]